MSISTRLGLIQCGSVVQYGPLDADVREPAVDDPDRAVEEEEQHDPDGDRRHHVRQVEDRPERPGELLADPHQEHREPEGDDDPAGDHQHRVGERVLQRRGDLGVVGELAVVVEADRLRRRDPGDLLHAVVRERVVEAEEHRPEREDQEAEQPREQEEVGDPGLLLREAGEPAPEPRGAPAPALPGLRSAP